MDRIWLNSYPDAAPAEARVRAYPSLVDLFEESCRRFAERPAFTHLDVTLTYAELERLSARFGACLQRRFGLGKGDRIAIMLPNLLQYPVALFGALRAGLVVVNVNPLYTARELAQQLADCRPSAVLVLENFAYTLQQALESVPVPHVVTTQVGDLFPPLKRWTVNLAVKRLKRMVPRWRIAGAVGFRDALAATPGLERARLGADDLAFLQYTGGTTGAPKGAMLSHGNMVANVEQTLAWVGGTLVAGEETVVSALPLYHVFALTANLLLFVRLGGNDILVSDARDIPRLIRTMKKSRFSAMTGVNTLFNALLDADGFDQVRRANRGALKLSVAGGMAVQRAVAERWQQAMGVPLVEGYGLTEASPNVCANRFDAKAFSGKLGLPLPSTEVSIMDKQGDAVRLGEVGEIWVRGPQVMRGYWNRPAETASVLTPDGWLKTGDLGWMDENGYVGFTERRKDMIVVSGFKAYPSEIEQVAMLHPGVKDAGAVGAPDERSGEAVVLFVVRADSGLTADAVREHCAKYLTGYKRPRRVEFRDSLPKTPLGKIFRRRLRDDVLGADG